MQVGTTLEDRGWGRYLQRFIQRKWQVAFSLISPAIVHSILALLSGRKFRDTGSGMDRISRMRLLISALKPL
jgi:hypothetical protein